MATTMTMLYDVIVDIETTPTLYDVKPEKQQSGDTDDANYSCHDDEQVHGGMIKSLRTFLTTPVYTNSTDSSPI